MQPVQTRASVRIDSARPAAFPLSKERIAIYNSGLVPGDRYARDLSHIASVGAESLRIDLGWGAEWMPWNREVVERDPDGSLRFDFSETDLIAKLLASVGTRPYWSYCYVPKAARGHEDDWRTMTHPEVWVETVRAYAAGCGERDVTIGYHEIYNEPDLRDERTGEAVFYAGQLEDYLELYRKAAPAVRAADPSARVGGPALAVTAVHESWLRAFCRMVSEERLPLDFLSFHLYGHFNLDNTLRTVREVLADFPLLRHVELHLNEYNAFAIDYPRGGLQDTHVLASAFAADIPRLLAHRELTRTHWAQFLDSGEGNFSGMVDIDGLPKPICEVYEFYQRMPVDRVEVKVDGPVGVGALASADAQRWAALVWNRHFTEVEFTLELPLNEGAVEVTYVDGSRRRETFQSDGGAIRLRLPSASVALVRGGAELAPIGGPRRFWGVPLAHDGDGWSDLDEVTGTFRFGTPGSGGWVAHAGDVAVGAAPDAWSVEVLDAEDAGPEPEAVVVRFDRADRPLVVLGTADDDLLADLPPMPCPPGTVRFLVAVRAPRATMVRITGSRRGDA